MPGFALASPPTSGKKLSRRQSATEHGRAKERPIGRPRQSPRNKKSQDSDSDSSSSASDSDSDSSSSSDKAKKKPASRRNSSPTTTENKKVSLDTFELFADKPKARAGKVQHSDSDSDSDSDSGEDEAPKLQDPPQPRGSGSKLNSNSNTSRRNSRSSVSKGNDGADTSAAPTTPQKANPNKNPPTPATTPATPPRNSTSSLTTMQIDLLKQMKRGTPFLKYGKRGHPHFRQFQVSEDNCSIVWFSKGKDVGKSRVKVCDITQVREGQTTPTFQRHKAPDLAKSSMSIMYNKNDSLDLIAKDPNEFKIWKEGICVLLDTYSKEGEQGLARLSEIVKEIPISKNRRSSMELTDAITGAAAAELQTTALNRVSNDPNFQREIVKNLGGLKKKLEKRKKTINSLKLHESSDYAKMMAVIQKVNTSIDRVNIWMKEGKFESCDDEIWRATVDLDSLKNMMLAIKKTAAKNKKRLAPRHSAP